MWGPVNSIGWRQMPAMFPLAIVTTRHHYLLTIWEAKYHYWTHGTAEENLSQANLMKKEKNKTNLSMKIWSRKDKVAGWKLKYFPVEVRSRGFTNNTLCTCFKFFGLTNTETRKTLDSVKGTALRATYTLWLARNTKQFGSWWTAHSPRSPTQLKMINLLRPK